MTEGLYSAADAMQAQVANLDAIAGNLANLSTPGYKRDIPAFSSQLQYLLDNPPGIEPSEPAPEFIQPNIAIDLSDGNLRHTQNPCDLGLQGKGFLVVETPQGLAYTRSGALRLDAERNLTTHSGHLLQGESGAINLYGDSWMVRKNGEVVVDGAVVDRLKLVEIPAEQLVRAGDGLFVTTGEPTELDWSESEVNQGYLEVSNANTMWEMVSLVTAMRTFEANQKIIQSQDETLSQAVSELGRV